MNPSLKDWGASIIGDNVNVKQEIGKVRVLHLASFVNNIVKKRRLPSNTNDSSVVMKMDIEGSENEVLTDLILRGSFTVIDAIHIEFHPKLANKEKRKMQNEQLEVTLNNLADISNLFVVDQVKNERFGLKPMWLPKC